MNPRSFLLSVGRFLAVAGSVCLLGPIVGFAYTFWTGYRQSGAAFETHAAVDPPAVHAAFTVTLYGLWFGLPGVVLVCLAVLVFGYASTWLRGTLFASALFLLPAFPLGTIFALVLFLLRCNQRPLARPAAAA